jgi:hypothetical protein
MVFRGKERRKTFFSASFFVFFFCDSVAFLRHFLHFLLCLSRDRVSVWCVPLVCLILASEILVCWRDHKNFFSYLRLDVLLRHLIIVLFTTLFTSVPWLFRNSFLTFPVFPIGLSSRLEEFFWIDGCEFCRACVLCIFYICFSLRLMAIGF